MNDSILGRNIPNRGSLLGSSIVRHVDNDFVVGSTSGAWYGFRR